MPARRTYPFVPGSPGAPRLRLLRSPPVRAFPGSERPEVNCPYFVPTCCYTWYNVGASRWTSRSGVGAGSPTTTSYIRTGRVDRFARSNGTLGRKPPETLSKLSEELGQEVVTRQWGGELARIRAAYKSNLERMPPSGRDKELDTFAIHFTYDSNRIEGSSLTLRETASLLSHGITPSNRPLTDVQETVSAPRGLPSRARPARAVGPDHLSRVAQGAL